MINRIVLTGRLTRDLELRRTQSGTSVVSFTLAVDRNFKKEGQPEADFINCVAWNRQAEAMAQYLHRGSLRSWKQDNRLSQHHLKHLRNHQMNTTERIRAMLTRSASKATNCRFRGGAYGHI